MQAYNLSKHKLDSDNTDKHFNKQGRPFRQRGCKIKEDKVGKYGINLFKNPKNKRGNVTCQVGKLLI